MPLVFHASAIRQALCSSTVCHRASFRLLHSAPRLSDSQPIAKGQESVIDRPVPARKPRRDRNRVSFLPFLAIFLAGTGLFAYTVKQREAEGSKKPKSLQTEPIDPEKYPGIKNRKPRREHQNQ